MEKVIEIAGMIWSVLPMFIAALIGLGAALVGVFVLIPGPHPEDWIQKGVGYLQKAQEFIAKISRKPAA